MTLTALEIKDKSFETKIEVHRQSRQCYKDRKD